MLKLPALLGSHNILFMTLDTLRYDVAQQLFHQGRTPFLDQLLPATGWEERHSPGSFTYAAHQAFFAGFLPTPARPGRHARLFAARFPGSETTTTDTFVFDAPDIVSGLAREGYHTICIGGVGFFNQQGPLGSVLPGLFQESYWSPALGVTDPDSTAHQVELACRVLAGQPAEQRIFLFMNVSALHQPNYFYLPTSQQHQREDSLESHAAALEYVDSQLPPLFHTLQERGPLLAIICGDHGTAYGEDGYSGHRLAHPVVWTVPYIECLLPASKGA
ncbi:membrane protein [Dictyobacter alpinus]|uniref:Membrane protein n=1 Tax=Dictyobacter alpinus TaxID=2014873 RepID=A0A402BCL0_9CHLR|nr:STM4013/SEN3800 family hydrolase [Dictyobacter alpinus]GCE29141.1 membrane protein [Dictyobacter alpinus]